jgi:hypothetical protein
MKNMGIKVDGMVYRCPYCKALLSNLHTVKECQKREKDSEKVRCDGPERR